MDEEELEAAARGGRDSYEIIVPVGDARIRLRGPKNPDETGERISFWWSPTSSAIALAEHVMEMGLSAEMRVMELGCGLGLVGLSAGLCGAKTLLTDYVPEAVGFAAQNAGINQISGNVKCRVLDWENPGDLPTADLIVGSEIAYDYFFQGALVELMDRTLASTGKILLADRKRLVVT
ncbi:MAG: methyltransferase domain-containing protein, partial [Pseudomonadota bacterium]